MELDLDLDYTAILSQKEGEERMVGKKRKGGTCKNSLMCMFGWKID